MATPVFIRADRDDARVRDALAAMTRQITVAVSTPHHDRAPDDRIGVDHPAAVEHILNWLDAWDTGWHSYISVGLPGGGWT